jgi:hypothetical protein
MSRRPSSEQLIEQLSRDLAPVRPVPPLRAVGLALVGVWLAGVALSHWLGGAGLRLTDPGSRADPLFLGVFLGLGLAGAGGCLAAVARAVPGCERLARAGLTTLGVGFFAALCIGVLAWLRSPTGTSPAGVAACTAHAAVLALAPAALAFAWLARAWEPRPTLGAWVAGLAAAALGASAVHAACLQGEALHVLLGHAVGPGLVAAGLAVAGRIWLVRRSAAA